MIIQLPTSDKNDKNKKNDNENRKPTSMWRDDVDTPQTSMGGGFRGVPMGLSSQVHSMGFQEPSFDSGYVRIKYIIAFLFCEALCVVS